MEDDPTLARTLKSLLEKLGFEVLISFDGKRGYELATTEEFDLILLDFLLPSMDGESLLKSLRQAGVNTPVLVLTVVSDVSKKVDLLSIGADDYLTKPFHLEELLARIKALIRRSYKKSSDLLKAGPVLVDTSKKKVYVNDREVMLTASEYSILEYLLLNRGKFVSRDEILLKALSSRSQPESNSVEVLISRLRKKLGIRDFIKSARGFGYIVE
ncbi:response regulator transcription factor [Thermocrinis minervae]|uniref:response regulator transcription factor n=1 Tax=Thermocrinis minervae TaxID=381751 RepID=UPI0022B25130|nr:response regulator transcription factor [Thermocrinis minervae]